MGGGRNLMAVCTVLLPRPRVGGFASPCANAQLCEWSRHLLILGPVPHGCKGAHLADPSIATDSDLRTFLNSLFEKQELPALIVHGRQMNGVINSRYSGSTRRTRGISSICALEHSPLAALYPVVTPCRFLFQLLRRARWYLEDSLVLRRSTIDTL